jgi:hypothetical protein
MNLAIKERPDGLAPVAWVYGLVLPLAYLVVELSFCNQLLRTLGDHSPDDVLTGFEFWGRLISGFGLGILIHRIVAHRLALRVVGFLLSIAAGIVVMWHVQKALIHHLVESAQPQDKRAALVLVWIAPQAGEGLLNTLSGQPLVASQPSGLEKNIVVSMFPAAALHAPDRQTQFAQWLQASGGAGLPVGDLPELEKKAYRGLIVAPLVIGLSLFFGLLNLSLAVSFAVRAFRPRWRAGAAAAVLAGLTALSLNADSVLLDARGYEASLRPALWDQAPVLAVLVEWSARSATQWAPLSELAHRHLLLDYAFKPLLDLH